MSTQIEWIEGTPLAVEIQKIYFVSPHTHEDVVEITMCLSGEIEFSYCFEEFTLREGEFLLVDKDVHFLSSKGGVSVSFYFDLKHFEEKYPHITSLMFVCEHTAESKIPYNTERHKQLKLTLLALLSYILGENENEKNYKERIISAAEKILVTIMNNFDIIFYYKPERYIKSEMLVRYQMAIKYMYDNYWKKITLGDLADYCGISEIYMSEFLNKMTIGFRAILGYVRTAKSEGFLMNTDLTLTEVSERCGFSDTKYYYAAFKKWYGCTPGEFRKKYKKEMGKENIEITLDREDIKEPLNHMIKKQIESMYV